MIFEDGKRNWYHIHPLHGLETNTQLNVSIVAIEPGMISCTYPVETLYQDTSELAKLSIKAALLIIYFRMHSQRANV